MRSYAQVSGTFFGVIAVAHLVRLVMRWPVHVADLVVPVWASAGGFVLTAALAIWAFRTAARVT